MCGGGGGGGGVESKKNGRIEGWVHNTGHCSKNQWCVKGLYRRIFWARLKWPPLQVTEISHSVQLLGIHLLPRESCL